MGLAVGIAVIRRLGLRGQRELLAAVPDDVNRAAAEAVSDAFLDPLLAVTQTLLIGLAVVAVVVVLSGPYPWAVRLRANAVDLGRRLGRAGTTVSVDDAQMEWLRAHRSQLQLGGVALLVVVLLVVDLSFLGLVLLGVLAAAGGLFLHRIPPPVDVG